MEVFSFKNCGLNRKTAFNNGPYLLLLIPIKIKTAPGETALEQESSNGSAAPTTEPAQKPAANPFRKDPNAGTNPFNQ